MSFDLSPVEVQFTADMAGLRRDMEEMKRLVKSATEDAQKAAGNVRIGDGVATQARGAIAGVDGIAAAFSNLRGVAQLAIIAGPVAALKAMSDAALDGQVQLDKLRNTLTFTSGSSEGAGKELDYIRSVSRDLGLELGGTAKAYAKLSAAAKGTSLEGANVKKIFESVAKASVVMGLSQEESAGALLAISQMMSKGTVQAEELRGQLGERLPGAFQIAARAMGTTTQGLGKMLEQGQVIASDFLPKFAEELEKTMGAGVEKSSHSAQAAINRMASAWTEFKMSLADAGGASAAIATMNTMTGLMNQFTQGVRDAKDAGWNGLSAFLAGIGRMEAHALGIDAVKSAREQIALLRKERQEVEAKSGKWSDSPNNYDGMNDVRLLERARRIKEINAEIQKLTREGAQGIKIDLKRDFEAQLAAQSKVLDGYTNDASRKTNAQKLAEELKAEKAAFDAATVGISASSTAYKKALAAFNEKKSDITKKYQSADGKEHAAAYKSLSVAVSDYLAQLQQQAAQEAKLTKGEQLSLEVKDKLTKKEQKRLSVSLKRVAALEQEEKARKQKETYEAALLNIADLRAGFERDDRKREIDMRIMPADAKKLAGDLLDIDNKAKSVKKSFREMFQNGNISPKQYAKLILDLSTAIDTEKESVKRSAKEQERLNGMWEYGAEKALQSYIDSVRNVAKDSEKLFTDAFKGMEDALVKFAQTGKLDFKSLADSIVADLIRIQVRQSMMPMMNSGMSALMSVFGFGGSGSSGGDVSGPMSYPNTPEGYLPFPSAKGNVFASADLHQYANTISSSPTLFKFAKGGAFGVFGEAGPEAIMPLTRGADGNLGVRAHGAQGGGESNVVVNIIESPGKGGRQEQRSENGVKVLDVFVEQIKSSIASDISRGSGAVPAALAGTYALNRVAGAY